MHPISTPSWETVHSAPPLGPGRIHLWHVDLSDLACAPDLLSEPELSRMQAFLDRRSGDEFCAMRGLLKRLAGAYCDCLPEAVRIGISDGGKPHLAGPACDLTFNLSHSRGIGLLAFARGVAVGVDIECRRELPNWRRIAQRSFDQPIPEPPPAHPQPPDAFFQRWTELEARQKCFGRGIFTERVGQGTVDLYRFNPAAGQFASIAWAHTGTPPGIRFLRYRDTPADC